MDKSSRQYSKAAHKELAVVCKWMAENKCELLVRWAQHEAGLKVEPIK